MTDTTKSEKFKQICDDVWRDRATIITRLEGLSSEAALVRAVYWRLCNAWGETGKSTDGCYTSHMLSTYEELVGRMLMQHAGPQFDGASLLGELVRRYRDETGQSCIGTGGIRK